LPKIDVCTVFPSQLSGHKNQLLSSAKRVFLVFSYHLTMSAETSATEALLGNPYYLNYHGQTVDTCLSCGHVIGAESQAPGANEDWLKYYRARECTHSN
jgi:hypothetical protein